MPTVSKHGENDTDVILTQKKLKHMKALVLIFSVILFSQSCKKEPIENDPQKLILGKWELVAGGNWPDDIEPLLPILGYYEYLPDSVLRYFRYEENEYVWVSKYWMNDSSLFILMGSLPNGYETWQRNIYEFSNNNNTLRLTIQDALPIFDTNIFNRKK